MNTDLVEGAVAVRDLLPLLYSASARCENKTDFWVGVVTTLSGFIDGHIGREESKKVLESALLTNCEATELGLPR